MSSMASLGRMVSGLVASQRGLQVTGHNLSNLNTVGYTRQQMLLHDSSYIKIGTGTNLQQVGLGVSISEIRQVRDEFVDKRLRTESSILNFYQTKQETIGEVEAILDEPYGETLSGYMEDFWKQAQKLSTNPSGVEERLAFIQTADVLIKRANQIFGQLETYQQHLNTQIKQVVNRINDLTKGIKELNDAIKHSEINGDNANDYRDQRNLLIDELSGYMDITYSERKDGTMEIKAAGRSLVDGEFVTEISVEFLPNKTGFVTPIWKDTGKPIFNLNKEINAATGTDSGKLIGLLVARGEMVGTANTSWEDIALNDNKSVDYNGNSYMIPKIQKQLAELVKQITELTNDTLSGKGIDGGDGLLVFVPIKGANGRPLSQTEIANIHKSRAESMSQLFTNMPKPKEGADIAEYDELIMQRENAIQAYNEYIKTDPKDANYEANKNAFEQAASTYAETAKKYEEEHKDKSVSTDVDALKKYSDVNDLFEKEIGCVFSPENMQVNPQLLKDGGYNHLGTVGGIASDIGDNSLVVKLLNEWSTPKQWGDMNDPTSPKYKETNFMDYYAELVSGIGREGFESTGKVTEKYSVVGNLTNERLSIGGVSQDEELTNMLKYQYAYNSSARMISVLDGMMDVVINRM
ncbi:MAG: flagellar hook-associated protein FlgK [Cellulosilyticaceae bacterium]